jgi:small subunit ribosomal protein S16
MALKIRLRKQGRTNRPFYRIVVTESRNRRDGKFIEAVGWYNPIESAEERHMLLKADRIQHWLDQGAQLSEKAETLVARGAPAVVQQWKAKQQAKAAKLVAKRKARQARKS